MLEKLGSKGISMSSGFQKKFAFLFFVLGLITV